MHTVSYGQQGQVLYLKAVGECMCAHQVHVVKATGGYLCNLVTCIRSQNGIEQPLPQSSGVQERKSRELNKDRHQPTPHSKITIPGSRKEQSVRTAMSNAE